MKPLLIRLAVIAILLPFFFSGDAIPFASAATTVPESNEFATRVLHDAWDMSEFSDISQGLNNSGQANYLQNIQVQNGVFSAQATSVGDAQFLPLFAGYETAIKTGKQGALYPISSSTYHCLHIAMQVSSASYYQFLWFADDRTNNGTWGYSSYFSASPSIWRLYSVDLATNGAGGQGWSGNATWQQLRIDPTQLPNVSFAVDWVRLTDCAANNTTVSWPAYSGNYNAVWLTSGETGNNILVKTGISGTALSTPLDTQGLPPGTYTVRLGTSTTCCVGGAGTVLTVNQAPMITFSRPSPTSGTDYATQAGNAWDFSDTADVTGVTNLTGSVSNGVFTFSNTSGDPQIRLNTPQVIANGSTFRYLTFRMYTQPPLPPRPPIQNVPDGMMARWIWAAGTCEFVSQDIPYDVGWQTYTIDLSDPFNGSVEETACSGGNYAWSTSQSITRLRFDPNENQLGQPIVQQLDWIRLTQPGSLVRGTSFPLQISLNKALTGTTLNVYYTTDVRSPTQHSATGYGPQVPPSAQYRVYIPLVLANFGAGDEPLTPNSWVYQWNTSSVTPGTYYMCVAANDGLNQTTSCSEIPITIN